MTQTESLAESSWRFHRGLESFSTFLRRERRAFLIFGCSFVAILLAILFSVDAPFFYPRIETDQLLYLLKAKSLVETGTTAARSAVNNVPFAYAAMPGVLRAPFLLMFSDFDAQLRGIQLMNVVIIALTGAMAAYVLSWGLPAKLHATGIAFTYGFMLLSPDWLTNTFVPLADAPYAFLTLSALLLIRRVAVSAKPVGEQKTAIAVFVFLVTTASFVRVTAPALLVYAAVLLRGRWASARLSRRTLVMMLGLAALCVVTVGVLNFDAIFTRYVHDGMYFIRRADKSGMVVNALASAFPAQIIPVFNLGFQVPPHSGRPGFPVFATTPRDALWCLAGMFISLMIIRGMFLVRRKFLPELAYLFVALPVLALLVPSTTRYLMSYQSIVWIAFFTSAAVILQPLRSRLTTGQVRAGAIAAILIAAAGVVGMRYARTAKNAGSRSFVGAVTQAFNNAKNTERTFRKLRTFLESHDRDRTLLIGGRGNTGLFTVIANRDYYRPDSSLSAVAREKDVLALLACGTVTACSQFDYWIRSQDHWIGRFGTFRYATLYDEHTASTRAMVRKVIPFDSANALPPQSASGQTAR